MTIVLLAITEDPINDRVRNADCIHWWTLLPLCIAEILCCCYFSV